MSENECACTAERCDIFEFMAVHVGMTVIHPGGLAATRRLAEACHLDARSRVIDIACGKGTSAVYLAEKYGCEVVGVDIDERLVEQAAALAKRRGLNGKVTFRVGDALALPFANDEFDAAISQAMLVLVDDQQKAAREALRVIQPNGFAGWLELSWREEPTEDFLVSVSNVLCAYCMLNVHTSQDWKALLEDAGVKRLEAFSSPLKINNSGIVGGMLTDEGLTNTLRIMGRYVTDPKIRRRMRTMDRFFRDHSQMFGYGIFVGSK